VLKLKLAEPFVFPGPRFERLDKNAGPPGI